MPRTEAYEISCSATFSSSKEKSTYKSTTSLPFLPNPPTGSSATKMDLKTGALLARPADGSPGPYAPVFAMGFYTQFDGYLTTNLSVLNELKAQGYVLCQCLEFVIFILYILGSLSYVNFLYSSSSSMYDSDDLPRMQVHPIPDFNNLTQLSMVLDRMQEVGLYLMYDMRK